MGITITFYEQSAAAQVADSPKPESTLLRRLIEVRTRQAEAHVRRHMMWLGDETLRECGLTPEQFAILTTKGRLPLAMTSLSRAAHPAAVVRHDSAATMAKPDRWIMRATKSLVVSICTLVARSAERRLHRLTVRQLHSMSDRLLKDIGISRSEIDHVVKFGRQDAN
jgi:uncharacterized protein YjiS (DUF1127 family)